MFINIDLSLANSMRKLIMLRLSLRIFDHGEIDAKITSARIRLRVRLQAVVGVDWV
jgi:hypothetical protein